MYVELISKDEFLAHHGVKGQSWGDRNGPPYPLSRLGSGTMEKIRKRRKLKLQKENEKIRKRNAALRKRNAEIEENRRLKERQRELKEETRKLKKNKVEKKVEEPAKEIEESPIQKQLKTEDVIKKKNLTRKEIRNMSNEELRVYIDRLQLEKQLWNLDNDAAVTGKKVVGDIMKKAGKESAEAIAKTVFTGVGKYAIKKMITSVADENVAREIMGGDKKKDDKKDDSGSNNNQNQGINTKQLAKELSKQMNQGNQNQNQNQQNKKDEDKRNKK